MSRRASWRSIGACAVALGLLLGACGADAGVEAGGVGSDGGFVLNVNGFKTTLTTPVSVITDTAVGDQSNPTTNS